MKGKSFIRRLQLENFLSYGSQGEEIELQPLNILIGANASGKSNLIEAIGLLKATPTDLPTPIRQGGGISDFLWKGQQGIPPIANIQAIVDYPQNNQALRYQISLTIAGQKLELSDALVSALPPEAVLVCERDEKGSHLRRLDPEKLKNWLENYTLGEVWRMGEIGGNRW